jgi:dethiobiotin synthetase
LAERRVRVAAFKPVVTGLGEETAPWPPDHELLARAASAGQGADGVAPYRFRAPASPHYAAELAGRSVQPSELVRYARAAGAAGEALVVEGVGGLMVPLAPGYLVRDLALELALPLVVASRPGLGTINHTLLTVEAARAAGLRVAGVVLTPWPREPSGLERSNRETIAQLSGLDVAGLGPTEPRTLATAGRYLPLEEWMDA